MLHRILKDIEFYRKHDKDKINQESLARKRNFRGRSVNMVLMAECIKKGMIKQTLEVNEETMRLKGENKFQGEDAFAAVGS